MPENGPVDGAAVAREFIRHSPFAGHLGLEVEALEDDLARMRLPFKPDLATTGEVVHGGAISTLIDTAATVAAWSARFDAMPTRWGTASMTVNFMRPAVGDDLLAVARVTRRGRNLCFCDVSVECGGDEVATGSVVYTLSS